MRIRRMMFGDWISFTSGAIPSMATSCLGIGLVLVTIGCAGTSPASQMLSSPSNFPAATVPLVRLSTDTFTNASSQHATEVEPGSFAVGPTIVASFQVGRIASGGAADIGFAISNDSGATWQDGLLPGLTTFQGGGTNSAVSDTTVAFDAASNVWLISSLTISASSTQVAVSRSTDDGVGWSLPVIVAQNRDLDKDWLVCDDFPASPHFGNCYMEWDDNGNSNQVLMSTSSDAGATWSAGAPVAGANGLGGQPLVQPNGKVVVPFLANVPSIQSFSSSDGGASWGNLVRVADVSDHQVQGGLRSDALPSAQEDAAGNVYVVWQDCRFRASCSSNDLVVSTSSDGSTWTSPARIPIDAISSGMDHFIPGLGIDPATGGASAHLGLTYYFYPQANCSPSTCRLFAGFISSADGGNTWSVPTSVAGPMSLSWLPTTDSGQMVADYIATSFSGGKAFGFFAVAKANSGGAFDEAIYTTQNGFDVAAASAVSKIEREIPKFTFTKPSHNINQTAR